ncbi:sigma-54-dependent transcriptional regulator [Shewanella marina]|uniref:sigma-54-dependent transcriptional regulator n=1 Tax=Shewanella marina TaxID=487319 RepID=UPI00046FB5B9|nr:sigma 54-interacting transcriptional regulator [Shewanella marina]
MNMQTKACQPIDIKGSISQRLLSLSIIYHPDLNMIGAQYQLPPREKHLQLGRLAPEFTCLNGQQRSLNDSFISRSPILLHKQIDQWALDISMSSIEVICCNQLLQGPHLFDHKQLQQQGQVITLAGRVVLLLHYANRAEPSSVVNSPLQQHLIGISDNMRAIKQMIGKVASLKTPVMIRGESGTGKEIVAQALHQYGQRKLQKFVSVNMAAIPKELVSSELFGSVKGAFTGAQTRLGSFQQADKGSLFLDEIGEATTEVQVALLRALENGVVQAVGSDKEIKLDVRFIAATDADLEKLIGIESFRMPLLQRLSGIVIEIEPLAQRRADFGLLFVHFLQQAMQQTQQLEKLKQASAQQHCYWAWLFSQCVLLDWPGNVRQLKNVATQLAVSLIDQGQFSDFDWHSFVQTIVTKAEPDTELKTTTVNPVKRKPREISEAEIVAALELHQWQIKQAADELGISRTALYMRIDASDDISRATNLSDQQLSQSFSRYHGDLDLMVMELKISKHALKRRLNEIGILN